jgi:hypothetical protein
MLSDPIRLAQGPASMPWAAPADGGPPLGPDEAAPIPGHITFDEFLRGLNPLHHVPVVGTIYRAITGETIPAPMRVLGGALFGGGVGMMIAAATAAVEEFQPATRMLAVLRGQPDPMFPNGTAVVQAPRGAPSTASTIAQQAEDRLRLAAAQAAYQRVAN